MGCWLSYRRFKIIIFKGNCCAAVRAKIPAVVCVQSASRLPKVKCVEWSVSRLVTMTYVVMKAVSYETASKLLWWAKRHVTYEAMTVTYTHGMSQWAYIWLFGGLSIIKKAELSHKYDNNRTPGNAGALRDSCCSFKREPSWSEVAFRPTSLWVLLYLFMLRGQELK